MGTLEMRSKFFEGHGAAIGSDWTRHCVVFAFFLVFSSGRSYKEFCTAASVIKENYIVKIVIKTNRIVDLTNFGYETFPDL